MASRWFEPSLANEADRAACRELIRTGSKSFSTAALLLPMAVRAPAYAVYGFCRLSDDLVDVEGGAADAIARLRDRLDLAYARKPWDSPIDRAFADVVHAFALPRALPEALIDGLEWDVAGVACRDLGDLYRYGARVAGSVGAMMSVLMGVRDPAALARACDLGVAMQLTNIARDVGEDARAGRLYLPQAWMREAGIEPQDWLANPVWTPALGAVVERLLGEADRLYHRAAAGIHRLPIGCRPGIFAAMRLYREIGNEVRRRGHDPVTGRARVNTARKLALASVALLDPLRPGPETATAPPLEETAYLVEAVAATPTPARNTGRISDRVVWVAELFAELEARDRLQPRRI